MSNETEKSDVADAQEKMEGLKVDGDAKEIQWPVKKRDFHNHHFNSTMWDGFEFRDDDIVVATYAKSGTTWTQQILSQMIYDGAEDLPVADMSPWVDLRIPPKEVKIPQINAMTTRRFLKTHLPVDALVFSPKVKYIYIARDGRDVCWSMHNHHYNANDVWYNALNGPGLVGEPIPKISGDVVEFYKGWIEKDGYPWWPFWENIKTWWEIRHLPNVMFLHFNDLKEDMEGQMRRIAKFLDITINEAKWETIVKHCTFDYMKKVRHSFVIDRPEAMHYVTHSFYRWYKINFLPFLHLHHLHLFSFTHCT